MARTEQTVEINGLPHTVMLEDEGVDFFPSPTKPAPPADPAISYLQPDTAVVGAGPTEIQVSGTDFVDGSTIEIDQVAAPTTFVSTSELTTTYDPATEGTVVFTVRNPDNQESNSVDFVVSP